MLYTPEYQQLLVNEHLRRPWGFVGHTHSDRILALYREYSCTSILDYGCGQGLLAEKISGIVPIINYDPGIAKFNHRPSPCDLVVCTDVLEHIEPECLEHVFKDLATLTLKVIYFTVSPWPAKGHFPDGRNQHLIIESSLWWQQEIAKYFTIVFARDQIVIAVNK